VHLACESIVVG